MASILIVDDDAQIREMMRRMLERGGYDVIEAADGNVAMKRYREQPTDLIITDLIMPEKEGIETIIELKRNDPEVKIIAISGGGRIGPRDYLNMAKALGAAHTFSKPFDRREMLEVIGTLIEG